MKFSLGVLSLFSFLFLAFVSCKYNEQWISVNAGNEFSMEVPSWMEKTDELKPGAVLQYRNRFRNVYVLVIKENRDTLPELFSDYVSRNVSVIKNVLENPVVSDTMFVHIGGLDGLRSELFGNMGEEKIFYSHVSLYGRNGFNYQLCAWTRGEERKLRYTEDMNRMLNSFKFISE